VAERARLANPNPDARGWLLQKVRNAPTDWDCRAFYTVPGVVWTVPSDTCMTGRPNAPRNIAYDDFGREFVFRQPANESELAAIMSADSEEVFACYRFDGLDRWTVAALNAWQETSDIVLGWIRHLLATERDREILDGLRDYERYLTSEAFGTYIGSLKNHLASGDAPPQRR
jgi:hypothetical protein